MDTILPVKNSYTRKLVCEHVWNPLIRELAMQLERDLCGMVWQQSFTPVSNQISFGIAQVVKNTIHDQHL